MKCTHIFEHLATLALLAASISATPAATAQTVISNEILVSTTFAVNKAAITARCDTTGCRATKSLFAPIEVACPAATGHTCTFNISLNTKTSLGYPSFNGPGSTPAGFYQFLVDGAAPTIGPTDREGIYVFEKYVYEQFVGPPLQARLSYPASVLATVTNLSQIVTRSS